MTHHSMRRVALVVLIASLASPAWCVKQRSHAAKAEFARAVPCPSTGKPRASCPGYVIDHVVALCAGGTDAPANMQWQTVADARVKDRAERAQCRAIRAKGT